MPPDESESTPCWRLPPKLHGSGKHSTAIAGRSVGISIDMTTNIDIIYIYINMDDLGGTPILGNLYLSFLRPVFFFGTYLIREKIFGT